MPTVRVVCFSNGRLYAGGYGEFGYFSDPGGNTPVWHSLSEALGAANRQEEIWNIEPLADGSIIFQSFGRIFIYDGEKLRDVPPPGVMMFAQAIGNDLIVPVTGKGLYRWTLQRGFVLIPGSEVLGNKAVVGVTDHEDGIIVGTADAIYLLSTGRLLPFDEVLNERLRGQEVNRILQLRSGTLAIGTINNGVFLFTQNGGRLTHVNESSGLSNNTVLALFESHSGNLWLALDRGLDLLVWSPNISFVTGENSPPGMVYTAAFYKGAAYFGTNQGLYLQRQTDNGLTYEMLGGTAGQVWELTETPAGLLCGHNKGTYLIQGTTATQISNRSGGWMTIRSGDDSADLLQATYTGIQLLEWKDEKVIPHDVPEFSAPVRFLRRESKNRLLAIHGSNGGFLLTMSDDKRSILSIDTLVGDVLTKASLLRTNDGFLIQNAQGRKLLSGGALIDYDTMKGVPLGAGDYALGEEDKEWFIASKDRVKMYQGEKLLAELPLRLRFPYPGIIKWTEDEWLFLLEEGYAFVEPRVTKDDPPDLIIRTENGLNGDQNQLPPANRLTAIAYRENDLRFSTVLPVYDRAVKYRSRLIGYAEEWTEWSASGEREFTNLPEGDYRFEVEANWFESTKSLSFTVLPPWYRSALAYTSYVLLLAGFTWLLYRLHLYRLRNQARRLEVVRRRELQRERIMTRNRELEANVDRKSRELANTTLTLAKKNEMLLQLREEIRKARNSAGSQLNHYKMDKLIDRNLNNEEDWAIFESHFNEVHEAFLKRLREEHPQLTAGDLKLAAYLRMDLSSKEIAPLLHISLRGVENKRYRLRKKMNLEGGDDLNRYLLAF